MIRVQLQHLLVMDVPILLNWAGVYLGNSIYLFVAIVLGISEVRVLTHFCCSLRSLEASLQKNRRRALGWGLGPCCTQAEAGTRAGGLPGDTLVICPGPEPGSCPLTLPHGDNLPRAGNKQCNWNGG